MQMHIRIRQLAIVLFLSTVFMVPMATWAQTRSLTGTVIDATSNLPLSGVSIILFNNSSGTTTDANGRFALNVPSGANITISYLGYTAQTIKVPKSGDVIVRLELNTKSMDEVVVIGYGQAKKKDLTGSITQIRPDKIADQNPNSVQDIIRGTAGVSVGFDPSAKGGGSIQIRGIRSVYTDGGH
ncbi:MAG TPA: carboxypeptidase-like regulatory domain-containing protein, partial [Flavisolibacter sp.]|nr:carboxypeptidase-like regulatory domain-containing protein [Flavisolibacter sp.]